jgi:hypothetical protein
LRSPYPKFDIRFGWVVLLALLLQIIVVWVGFGEAGVIRRFIFPSSYVLVLAFIALNRRRIGFLVIGAGMLLNFLAIVSNGGLMPVTPANAEKAGMGYKIEGVELGEAIPRSKNVLLEAGDIHLRWLADRFTWISDSPFAVFSIGDIVIAAGAVVLLLELLLPALQRGPPDRASPA